MDRPECLSSAETVDEEEIGDRPEEGEDPGREDECREEAHGLLYADPPRFRPPRPLPAPAAPIFRCASIAYGESGNSVAMRR